MEPFGHVDVLDFTQEVSGPHCTQLLTAFGANVVKVEPPGGERTRNEWVDAFSSHNVGKKSIGVDLKTDEGCEIVADLAETADVVVENFRPGVLERFDLDYESVAEENPEVVYCSISGFGQQGPYRNHPAYDPIAQALGGVMAQTGYPDQPPVRIGASFIDCGTAVHAALFISAALFDRERTGEGHYIDTSLFDTAVSWMAYSIANYSRTGEVSERNGAGNGPTDRVYAAADDEWFYVKAITQAQYERLCDVIDREDLLEDERFATADAREEHAATLRKELGSTFGSWKRDDLTAKLADRNVPIGAVQDVSELIEDPHVKSRRMLFESYNLLDDESIRTAMVPVRTEDGRPTFGDRPPEYGEHNRSVLSEQGYSDEEIDTLLERHILHEE